MYLCTTFFYCRYGDALNPWGDLIAMSRAWCVLRPGGRALLGVPTAPEDLLQFNGARIYGPATYPHLLANWLQVHTDSNPRARFSPKCVHCYQPLHVLERPTD